MTDDLDRLRAALKAAPPSADPGAKAAALARAMENFDRHQGRHQESVGAARPMSDRPDGAGFLTGVRQMLSRLTARPILTATASAAALCVGFIAIQPALRHGPVTPADVPKPAPVAAKAPEATGESAAQPPAGVAEPAASSVAPAEADDGALRDELRGRSDAPAIVAQDKTESLAPMPENEVAAAAADSAAPDLSTAAAPAVGGAMRQAEGKVAAAPVLAEAIDPARLQPPAPDTEAFANEAPNPVKVAAEDPVSTFSTDVDTASYGIVRSSVMAGVLPPPEAVRIEEMVNYFPYGYAAPGAEGAPFSTSASLFRTPWNDGTELLRIGLQGRLPATAERPPLNLVFLIDTSGSMEEPNKLPLLIQSFRLMVGKLTPADQVAIVTYAGSAGLVLEPTPASDQARILGALDQLMAGGSTAGAEGLQLAYQVADRMKGEGRIGRVLLATDGDFNVGIDDPADLTRFIAEKRDSGTYLSVLGFGRGNLDDATMQALAQNGNGTASYIDTLSEAQKVLVDQLTGALFPIADDVKIQIEFNPAAVAEYRLIGYETRALKREDFNNDRVDAGEIGAGLQVTALYEIVPVGSPARLTDPLRYGAAAADGTGADAATGKADELGFLKLRYKAPGADQSQLIEVPVGATPGQPDEDARFAAAIAGFGQLLTGGTYLGQWGWADAIALANGARGEDPYGYRAEAVQLMRLGESLGRP